MAIQAALIKKHFPLANLTYDHKDLIWRSTITPTPLSKSYEVIVHYPRDCHPDIFVISPKLELFPGADKLPHVYSTEKQWLCLYHRPTKEWKNYMPLHTTIIPWTYDWLAHYEVWLLDGVWHGGGTTHGTPRPNK